MNTRELFEQLNNLFCDRIANGEFEVLERSESWWKISVDGYRFTILIVNDNRLHAYCGLEDAMQIKMTQEQKDLFNYNVWPRVQSWLESRKESLAEIERLRKGL